MQQSYVASGLGARRAARIYEQVRGLGLSDIPGNAKLFPRLACLSWCHTVDGCAMRENDSRHREARNRLSPRAPRGDACNQVMSHRRLNEGLPKRWHPILPASFPLQPETCTSVSS
jgi:hypothetical protein